MTARPPVPCETDASVGLREAFYGHFPVPHETAAKLDRYAEYLVEWNEKFNLVAPSTLPVLWERHFLDSAQLFPLIPGPAATRLVDMGSGAGFPALILAIMGVGEVHCIESIGKKANFLRHVADQLALPVTVHQARIESVLGLKADIITARALTALPDLLRLAAPLMKKDSFCLFLKGEKADAELTDARKYWTFEATKQGSLTSPSGVILRISELKASGHEPKRRHKRP